MTFPEKHHRDRGVEDDLWIDLTILSFLQEEILLGNLDFVSLTDAYHQGFFSELDCSWEKFRRRCLYQVGLGFAEPRIVIYDASWKKVDTKKQTGYLPPLRVTPAGFMHIPELEKEAKKYEWFNRYLTKFQELIEKVTGMKGAIVVGITSFLIITIFVFDIKVSKIIEKIPILSSIIDTQVLADFEAINEKDEFYQALMSQNISSSAPMSLSNNESEIWTASMPVETSSGKDNTIRDGEAKQPDKVVTAANKSHLPIPEFLKRAVPRGVKIADIKVRSVSTLEKLFRITLDNGDVQYINVKKYDGKYQIIGE